MCNGLAMKRWVLLRNISLVKKVRIFFQKGKSLTKKIYKFC